MCPSSLNHLSTISTLESFFIQETLKGSELRSICKELELNNIDVFFCKYCFHTFSHMSFKAVIIKQASTSAQATHVAAAKLQILVCFSPSFTAIMSF